MIIPEAEGLPPAPPAEIRRAVISQNDIDVVAACLVGEAGGEGTKGMQAVMNVISNRARGKAEAMRGVVLKPKQFSVFNGAKVADVVAKMKRHPMFAQASMIVRNSMMGNLPDITGRATHYHAHSVNPSWAKSMKVTGTLGGHKFYKESV